MWIFILGLDELKYNIVAENELENLKQKEYGKLGLPRQVTVRLEGGNLASYTLFVSSPIVTGRLQNDTGIKGT
jgi:hypothetical protein